MRDDFYNRDINGTQTTTEETEEVNPCLIGTGGIQHVTQVAN